ncbi:hypothetical protein STRAU_6393 [Streptomyces aurantiacus JA 4570]|uniref:Uncharacterized protein n=1 Tax=Streptomyces aurantiacus JA 4570 TaxID=1286094 RepID=S3ZD44_9ACTN|nr:hypothetical protein STRAU_6393 [Streptomyces aurantiacus JA 4570]
MRRGARRTLGVVTVPGTVGRLWKEPGEPVVRDHCRRSSAHTAEGVPPHAVHTVRTALEGCLVGADRATDRASSFMRPVEYSAGALPLYPGISHTCPAIWSRRGRHSG